MKKITITSLCIAIGVPIVIAIAVAIACFFDPGDSVAIPSDYTGSERVFVSSRSKMIQAITNAFGGWPPRPGWSLIETTGELAVPAWRATNGFILWPLGASIGEVPLSNPGGRLVPYFAEFYISAESLGTNQTRLTVRTVSCYIIDGKEIGVHGGLANHSRHVPPVRQEETNIIDAIEKEWRLIQ